MQGSSVSGRVIHHWESTGLLECERIGESGWRKFNIIEFLWLRVVQKLRDIGLSIDKILRIKPFYFELYKIDGDPAYIDYYIVSARVLKKPVFFVILLDDEQAEFMNQDQMLTALSWKCLGSYITINLNDILNTIFTNKIKPNYRVAVGVSRDLAQAVDVLQYETYDTATISKKGNDIQKIELDKHFDHKTPDKEILDDHENADIIKKKRNGKFVTKKRKVITELGKYGFS